MKSRITIEVDFDNGQPYIKVLEDKTSDDVRDKLITFFRQRLGHTSSWCTVEFPQWNENAWIIRPITPDKIQEQASIMGEQMLLNVHYPKQDSVSH